MNPRAYRIYGPGDSIPSQYVGPIKNARESTGVESGSAPWAVITTPSSGKDVVSLHSEEPHVPEHAKVAEWTTDGPLTLIVDDSDPRQAIGYVTKHGRLNNGVKVRATRKEDGSGFLVETLDENGNPTAAWDKSSTGARKR